MTEGRSSCSGTDGPHPADVCFFFSFFFSKSGQTAPHGSREQEFKRAVAFSILCDSIKRARSWARPLDCLHTVQTSVRAALVYHEHVLEDKIHLLLLGINQKSVMWTLLKCRLFLKQASVRNVCSVSLAGTEIFFFLFFFFKNFFIKYRVIMKRCGYRKCRYGKIINNVVE